MKLSRYIKNIEKKNECVYSKVHNIYGPAHIKKIEENKNLTLIFGNSEFRDRKINFNDKLYVTNSGFYIYWKLMDDNNFSLTIYYKIEQLQEVMIYLLQLNK